MAPDSAIRRHTWNSCTRWLLLALLLALLLFVTGPVSAAPSRADPQPIAAEPVRYAIASVAEPGGRVLFYFEMRNSGTTGWAPGSVVLANLRNPLGAATPLAANRNVLPNETVYWDFEISAPKTPGVYESVWQLMRAGAPVGPRLACYVIVVPAEARELRAKIQRLIDDFNEQHGYEVEQLIRQIRDLLAREGGGLIERLLRGRCGLLPGMLGLLAVGIKVRHAKTPVVGREV